MKAPLPLGRITVSARQEVLDEVLVRQHGVDELGDVVGAVDGQPAEHAAERVQLVVLVDQRDGVAVLVDDRVAVVVDAVDDRAHVHGVVAGAADDLRRRRRCRGR